MIASEERVLYAAMMVAGLPPVIGAIASHSQFGGGVSLCLGLVALGLAGLVARRRNRTPSARARRTIRRS